MNLGAEIFALAAGGAAGAALRGWLGERFAALMPWVTLGINAAGSFAAGFLLAHYAGQSGREALVLLLVPGFCGGFTTFSTLAFQLLVQWRDRHSVKMALYLALTLALGLAAAWAGLAAGRG